MDKKWHFDREWEQLKKRVDTLESQVYWLRKFKDDVEEKERIKAEKEKNQPSKIKTSGSTFKNPINQTDIKVWELIKNSIPTTKSFGDAKISEKHCNFLVNSKNAKFEDMMKLINFIKSEVEKKKNIKLETEIEIIE